MDALTFSSEMVKALAWPTAVLIVVLVLRGEIKTLLSLVKKLKAGPVEAEFDREVRELARETEGQLPPPTSVPPSSAERQKLLQLAELNPRSAIIEAWHNVEFAARRVVEARDPSITARELQSSSALLRSLNRYEILSRDEVVLFNDLRALRNQAVHLPEFSPAYDAVLNYIDLALRLKFALEGKVLGGVGRLTSGSRGPLSSGAVLRFAPLSRPLNRDVEAVQKVQPRVRGRPARALFDESCSSGEQERGALQGGRSQSPFPSNRS